MYNQYSQYQINCTNCAATTTKKYAREHSGLCKFCATGIESTSGLYVCPDCGERRLTKYQKLHHYHCDTCTRNTEESGGVYGY